MWKTTLSAIAVLTAGASLALAQDAWNGNGNMYRTAQNGQVGPVGPPVGAPGGPMIGTPGTAQPGMSGGMPYGSYQFNPNTPQPSGPAAFNNCNPGCAADRGIRGWFGVDYELLFPSPLNMPVLLTATAAPTTLAGGSVSLGANSGIRINTGLWIDGERMAMQGIFYTTFRSYVTNTQPTGIIPTVGIGPLIVANFTYQSWHQFGGGEGNTLLNVGGDHETKFFLLGGTRYSSLEEDINITYTTAGGNFLDNFHSRNQFYGLQVGGTVSHNIGRLSLDGTLKVALGLNSTQLFVLGSNNLGAGFQAFTGRSNIGYSESNYFGLVPEANFNVSYRLTDRLTANVGYSFLCSINNWRPGDQITLNNDGGVTQPSVAPPVRSTYFLHGLNAGFTFRY